MSRTRKALSGLAVAALLLGALELTLRLVLGPPPPPVRVFAGLKDIDTYLQIDGDQVRTTYQAVPPTPQFALHPTRPRVAVLGGSSVHQADRPAEIALEWPARLGAWLDAQVLNLGEPGLDSFDHAAIVDELSPLGLSAVVLYAGHNDLGNTVMQARYGGTWGGLSAHLLSGLEHAQTFCQLRRLLTPPEGRPRVIGGRRPRGVLDTARRARATRYFEANLERIAWRLSQQGVPLVLVVPTGDLSRRPDMVPCEPTQPCTPRLWREGMSKAGVDPVGAAGLLRQARDADTLGVRASTQMQDFIRAMGARPGISVVDAARDLPRADGIDIPAPELFVDPMHYSTAGHEALAALVAPTVGEVAGVSCASSVSLPPHPAHRHGPRVPRNSR